MPDASDTKQLDKRTISRYLKNGQLDEKTYERHLKNLPDLEEKSAPIETLMDDELDDEGEEADE